eukprot:6481617-Amphidinium_carterae.1
MEPPLARVVAALPHGRFVAEVLIEVGLVSVDAILAIGADSPAAFADCLHALCSHKQATLVVDFAVSFHQLFVLVNANVNALDKEAVWMAMLQTQYPQDPVLESSSQPITHFVPAPASIQVQPQTMQCRESN